MSTHGLWTGIQRGLLRHCTACDEGKLLHGFPKISSVCSVCGANNGGHPPDEPQLNAMIVIAGHVVVPLFLWFDRSSTLPLWSQSATWLLPTALVTIGLLPFARGGVIGLCRATRTVRPDAS